MRSFPEIFRSVVETGPQQIAVAAAERKLTYAELDGVSNAVARRILDRPALDHHPVTLVLGHGASPIVAMLGAIKARRAYVPLDARDPIERVRRLHEVAGAQLMLTGSAQLELARQIAPSTEIVVVDEVEADRTPVPDAHVDTDRPAVVYYTSGSTGHPKGVVHSWRNEAHNAESFANTHGFSPDDRLGITGSFAFSASSGRVFGGLSRGSTLCTFDLRESGVGGLPRWIEQHQITVLSMVPSVLRALCDAAPHARLDSVRLVMSGGEPLLGRDVKRARELFGAEVAFCNRLSSTETLVIAENVVKARDVDGDGPLSCGRPVPWVQVEIVAADGEPAPAGAPGELVVFGSHLALGYRDDPDLTAERFFVAGDGRRGYRSGDRARLDVGGSIEHLGRLDARVKVRGAMVSTEEVEAALTSRADVAEAVVVGAPLANGGTRLVAYVAPAGGEAPSPRELRLDLSNRLASYLVPSHFLLLPELPRTTRGKVDRAALPPPTVDRPPFRAPQSPRGVGTAEVFEQLLGVEGVGLDDDFFDLGGDSIAAVELLAALSERFGVDLPVSTLLEGATVDELSRRVARGRERDAPTVLQVRGGSKRPFFCVCGGGATALALHWLGRAMDQERPLYGVQARGLDERARPDRTVEAAARRHLDEIMAIQPQGPYLLGGHSFGGMVAYQIARELQARKEEVALLVLLDADPPKGKGGRAKRRAAYGLPVWVLSRLRLRAALLTAGIVTRSHDRQYQLFYGLAGRLGDRYQPKGVYDGRTLLLRRSDRLGEPKDLGWTRLLAEPPEVVAISGGHEGMLRIPHVSMIAAALDAHLDRVDPPSATSVSSPDSASSHTRSPITELDPR